jgi:phage baseplate assembly protein W
VTDVPHFDLPFRFANPQAAVVEQDSVDEIANCVYALLICPLGYRVELPAYGLADPTFAMPAPDLDEIRDAIETWEERAGVVLDEHRDALDELIARVGVDVHVRTEA